LDLIRVRLTDPTKVLVDFDTRIRFSSRGAEDREGHLLVEVPLTHFVRQKLREGLLEKVVDPYLGLAVAQLRALCKARGIEVEKTAKKAELIALLKGSESEWQTES